jgi:magnesium transporter
MITIHYNEETGKPLETLALGAPLPEDVIWIDMHNPSHEELVDIERQLGIDIPTEKEIWKNNVLNRQYKEDGVAYMTAALITKMDSPYPDTSAVTFILSQDYLLTLRHITPTSFADFTKRIQRPNEHFSEAAYLFEGLLEEMITRVAHNVEVVADALDTLSHHIFGLSEHDKSAPTPPKSPSQMMKDVLNELGKNTDLNSKINESLHSILRLLAFFKHYSAGNKHLCENIETLITDAQALLRQTEFISNKITFQLDATLGMINVEQNLIIKIFSVVAVFFMPPTLVSSIYGMNFKFMPELDSHYGYPLAIVMMLLCALIPYLYFRKRGWL